MKKKDPKNTLYVAGLSIEEVQKQYGLQKVYKMGSNENPLPLPEDLVQYLKTKLYSIHRYPSYIRPIVKLASQYYNVDSSYLLLGNGSSELIDKLLQAYSKEGGAVLVPEKTFPLYTICAVAHGLPVYKSLVEENLKINVSNILSLLEKQKDIRLIFISNPNNPTGSYLCRFELELLLQNTKNKKVLVVLDEAYWGYTRAKDFPDSLAFLSSYPHLVILRSMSKISSLAGLRAGLILAYPDVINTVKSALCPFNVNILALEVMRYIFSQSSFKNHLLKSRQLIWKSLDYFYEQFKLLGLKYHPSQGNFILFSPGDLGAFDHFLRKGLILRNFTEPGLESYLRMSVGLEEENKIAVQWIKDFVKSKRQV